MIFNRSHKYLPLMKFRIFGWGFIKLLLYGIAEFNIYIFFLIWFFRYVCSYMEHILLPIHFFNNYFLRFFFLYFLQFFSRDVFFQTLQWNSCVQKINFYKDFGCQIQNQINYSSLPRRLILVADNSLCSYKFEFWVGFDVDDTALYWLLLFCIYPK